MLILSRKLNECIVIDSRIIVKVVRVEGQIVKLGIQAPMDVPVHRQEIYDEIQRNNQEAMTRMRMELPRLSRKAQPELAPSTVPPSPPVSIPAPPVLPETGKLTVSATTAQPDVADEPPAAAESTENQPATEKKTPRSRSSTSTTKAGPTKTKRSKNTS